MFFMHCSTTVAIYLDKSNGIGNSNALSGLVTRSIESTFYTKPLFSKSTYKITNEH